MAKTAPARGTGKREEAFNVRLADLLRARGMDVEAETIHAGNGGRNMPDVLVEWQGLRIAIEAKFPGTNAATARRLVEEQARKRVMQGFGSVGVALLYPSEIKDVPDAQILRSLERAAFEVRLFRSGGGPTRWIDVHGGTGLADVLNRARHELADDDAIGECTIILHDAIEAFARAALAQTGTTDDLLGLVSVADAAAAGRDTTRARDAAVRICGLALCTATLLQRRLAEREPAVPAVPEDVSSMELRRALLDSWKQILAIDYAPVFDIAHRILKSVANTPELAATLEGIVVAAEKVDERQVLGHHDVVGRVYHSLLADKKYLATYFTSVPAAVLLSYLALDPARWEHVDFSADAAKFDFRVGDLACGTGTLLTEAFAAVRANWIGARVQGGKPIDLPKFGAEMIERNLVGFDVLAYAVQVCAATLFLSSPGTTIARSHLRQMPFGGLEGRLGSLELLSHAHVQARMFDEDLAPVVGLDENAVLSDVSRPQVDLVVMNPPFTRSVGGSKLLGSLPEDAFATAREKLRELVRRPDVCGNLTAGIASPFVDLAVRCVREHGRIALVLPKTVLTGDAWCETRDLLASQFHIEYVVASHEPGHWNFSDSTDLSEVLIIGRRWNADEDRSLAKTSWVCLTRNPRSPVEALGVASTIRYTDPDIASDGIELTIDSRPYGELFTRPAPADARPWRHAVFSSSIMDDIAGALLESAPVPLPRSRWPVQLPLCPLGGIATIGFDRRDIHDGFTPAKRVTPYPALWGHDAKDVVSLAQRPNAYLQARKTAAPGRPLRNASELWQQGAARLMVPERLWLVTHSCVTITLSEPALSNTWWPVKLTRDDPLDDTIIALWLNSTLGIMSWIAASDETRGPWIAIKKDKLRQLAVLDPQAIAAPRRKQLARVWRSLADKPLAPIARIANDPWRAEIDEAICGILDVDVDHVRTLRNMLGAEPRLQKAAPAAVPVGDDGRLSLFDAVAS